MIHKGQISAIQLFSYPYLFCKYQNIDNLLYLFITQEFIISLLLQQAIPMTSASQKKINARIQKWRTMLSTGLHKDQALLHSRTRKGIPPQIRLVAWPQLVKLRKHIEQRTPQFTYEKLLNSLSNNIYEISLDIPRTFPEQQDTKVLRKSMNNVLKGIAIVHPKIGYCQGMNFLVARLLTVLGDQQVFWLMDYLVINDKYLRNNFINPKHIATNTSIFQRLLNKTHPHILPIFAQKSIFIQSYTIKCFMTLFSSVLSQQLFNRIFEVYLLQGWSIIYAVAIVLFTRFEKEYKNGSMEDIHLILSKKMYQVGAGDVQWVMDEAYKLELTPEKVRPVQIQVQRENAKTSKIGRGSMTSEMEVQKREQANKQMVKFMPQTQNFTTLIFQNKAEQVNFDPLYILSKKTKQ